MKNKLCLLLFIFLAGIIVSCKTDSQVSADQQKENAKKSTVQLKKASSEADAKLEDVKKRKERIRYDHVSEIISEKDASCRWFSDVYYPNFHFSASNVVIEYDGQCTYTYPVKLKKDQIVVYYAKNEDCIHHLEVKETLGMKKHPITGKPFMLLSLMNDTVLKATYLYPKWTDSVNAANQNYICFPEKMYSGFGK